MSANRRALWLVIVTTVTYGLAPLFIDWADADSPFAFAAVIQAGWAAAIVLHLRSSFADAFPGHRWGSLMRFPSGLWRRPALAVGERTGEHAHRASKTTTNWLLLPLVATTANYGLFVWAFQHADGLVATVVYETWPMLLVLVLAMCGRLRSRRPGGALGSVNLAVLGRYRFGAASMVLVLLLGVGLLFVVAGHHGAWPWESSREGTGLFGIVLAGSSALLAGAQPAVNLLYGASLHDGFVDAEASRGDEPADKEVAEAVRERRQVWFTVFAMGVASVVTCPVNVVLAVIAAGGVPSLSVSDAIVAGVVGALLFGVGGITHRTATAISGDVKIHVVLYLTPLLALGLLASLTDVDMARADLFVLGASLTVALVFLMQANPDRQDIAVGHQRNGFSALIVAVWAAGTAVYLRDEVLPASWLSWRGGEYWALVALSATVFALLLGFRTARLSARIDNEDSQILSAYRRAEALVAAERIPERVLPVLRAVDRGGVGSNRRGLRDAHSEFIGLVNDAHRDAAAGNEPQTCATLETLLPDVDAAVHSKQQGRDFTEDASLVMFAAVTAALVLLSRPADTVSGQHWQGMLSEVFAALFVAAVALMTAGLFDMRSERDLPTVASEQPSPDTPTANPVFGPLHYREPSDAAFERRIAAALTVALVATISALLTYKWF